MNALFAVAVVLFTGVGASTLFLKSDPVSLARTARLLGPILSALLGGGLMLLGRFSLGAVVLALAFAWFRFVQTPPAPRNGVKPRAMVRTAALEMELDNATGNLEGLVLAGRHEGKMLGAMGLSALKQLYRELSADAESRHLLEAYLDSRFPVWRLDAQPDGGERLGVAPGTGAMTKEEAYKVLGLEAGAAAADVREAHRRLMQRLNPDVGNTSFLAARINEAKDVLLSNHN